MTEWNAAAYHRIDGLQQSMAHEVIGRLKFAGSEKVLDVGCGDGAITAKVAALVPDGEVVGVDASKEMVEFASRHSAATVRRNLTFRVGDARCLDFPSIFDRVISFNALHWIQEQEAVLRGVWNALKPGGCAHLRLVPHGPRRSLEDVIETTAHDPRWATSFRETVPPFQHPEPEAYAELAAAAGFGVESVQRTDHAWDFGSHDAFQAFARVTFVEWTKRLPEPAREAFIDDALARYRPVASTRPGEDHCFKFYQMDVDLRRPEL